MAQHRTGLLGKQNVGKKEVSSVRNGSGDGKRDTWTCKEMRNEERDLLGSAGTGGEEIRRSSGHTGVPGGCRF
ncbi:MAG: hypothetical protein CSA35_08175 [Dethiosulfovibrio peptidovorans]|nr:MAG: hypothetical protein CSA35_08175 [Dethiosulfovibrio peptidovorans]